MSDHRFNPDYLLRCFNPAADLFEDVDPAMAEQEMAWAQNNLTIRICHENIVAALMPNKMYLVAECDGPGNFRIFGKNINTRLTTFENITDAEWTHFNPVYADVAKRYMYQTRQRILDTDSVAVIYFDPFSYHLVQESISGMSKISTNTKLVLH